MKSTEKRTFLHSLVGLASLLLFAAFMGNIVLTKLAVIRGFTAPRFSVQGEFLIMVAATLLGIIYLLYEEKQRTKETPVSPDRETKFQIEEERL